MSTPYATAESLTIYLGRDLTGPEEDAAGPSCAAASDYIDRVVGKSWQGRTVGGELQTVPSNGIVRLDYRPVASVTSVTSRSLIVGETPRVLVAGTDYELIDPLNGQILVNGYGYDVITTTGCAGQVLTIAYVVGTAVPSDIAMAANIIAAGYLVAAPAASNAARGIQKLKAGSAEITYDPIDREMTVPPAAYALLAAYRPAVLFV